MKKLSVIALAVAACMLFAIPAMAVDVDFSGQYRVRGYYEDNIDLNDDTGGTNAAMDMRVRIQPVIKIHDRLKVTMRFDGLDNRLWGTGTDENFKLDRLYLDADFDMFALRIGRMMAGVCGLKYCDSERDADRVKVILKNIEPFYVDYTYTKKEEGDYGDSQSDKDFDEHAILGQYSDETMTAGLLIAYDVNKSESSLAEVAGDLGELAFSQLGIEDITYNQKFWIFNPFFKGSFGPIAVEAEAQWFTGDAFEFENGTTVDYDAWRYFIEASFNYGLGNVGIGYAHADGQDPDDDDYTVAGLGGTDWEPLLILTHSTTNTRLGPSVEYDGTEFSLGNLNPASGDIMKFFGFDVFYLYGDYAVTENLTLNAILGFAWADETLVSGLDDELGWEFDIGAKWQLMDNLTYDAKFGYFKPGDFYDDLGTGDDDTWAVMHSLVVTF